MATKKVLNEERVRSIATSVFRDMIVKRQRIIQEARQSSLSNAGAPWTDTEDYLLAKRVRQFIFNQACEHGRSFGAIALRIRRKELLLMNENGEVYGANNDN